MTEGKWAHLGSIAAAHPVALEFPYVKCVCILARDARIPPLVALNPFGTGPLLAPSITSSIRVYPAATSVRRDAACMQGNRDRVGTCLPPTRRGVATVRAVYLLGVEHGADRYSSTEKELDTKGLISA